MRPAPAIEAPTIRAVASAQTRNPLIPLAAMPRTGEVAVAMVAPMKKAMTATIQVIHSRPVPAIPAGPVLMVTQPTQIVNISMRMKRLAADRTPPHIGPQVVRLRGRAASEYRPAHIGPPFDRSMTVRPSSVCACLAMMETPFVCTIVSRFF